MAVAGDVTTNALLLEGTGGTAVMDLTQMTAAKTFPTPVGVSEYAGWWQYQPTASGTMRVSITGPAGWQGVVELYARSPHWLSSGVPPRDWLLLLNYATTGATATAPVVASDYIYIRLHPYYTNDPVTDAQITWSYTFEHVAKMIGIGSLAVDGFSTVEPQRVVIPSATFAGDGALFAEPGAILEHREITTPVAMSGEGTLVASTRPRPVVRWRFNDPHESDSWTVPINPNTMSSPHATRTFKYAHGVDRGIDRLRVFETPHPPVTWEFGGVIRTKQHHDDLHRWAKKEHAIEITDHLRRTFEVYIQEFKPEDRRVGLYPDSNSLSDNKRWRMTYTMRALIMRRVS